ncbi:hypothetical protein [Jannaschia sp. W003]|uniref:hypothetical protein n=1 Tax=Jannaschia sp. W003 TaxID=2867012 RepID=UPI0021A666D2|nr:hypothetical protein [Jannaschia sp. W003]UWQ22950.1 hypothetical protein K3554_07975 [Jannaschia sp. W003]
MSARQSPGPHEEGEEFTAETGSLFRIAIAPTIWAVHFAGSYAAVAVYCAKFGSELEPIGGFRIAVALFGLVALALIAWTGWRAFGQWNATAQRGLREVAVDLVEEEEGRHEFLGHAALLLAVISFVGVIYTALPVLVIRTCV